VKGQGAVEFLEYGFVDLRDCRSNKVIVCGMVGDIPRDIEDSTEDIRLESLDALIFFFHPARANK
jgi:hypothetical protein